MHGLDATAHPDLIVGVDDGDDAGVFRISPDVAIVQTVDFFTPIVDDPADWGRITAANALSDVYAMGATPITALQLVGWPRDSLSFDLLGDVIEAGVGVMGGAGCVVVGGHSVDDPEPKYGFAVTGTVHPDRVLANAGGSPGDALVLTKPIGTGIIATAHKRDLVDPGVLEGAVETMATLNDRAGAVAADIGASAVTDVTGFGLLGHLREMLGDEAAELDADAVPILDGAQALAEQGVVPGGTRRNLGHAEGFTDFGELPAPRRVLLADAQTSGGLLMAVEPSVESEMLEALANAGVAAAVIGRLVEGPSGRVTVR